MPSPKKRHRRCPTRGAEEKARGENDSPGKGKGALYDAVLYKRSRRNNGAA